MANYASKFQMAAAVAGGAAAGALVPEGSVLQQLQTNSDGVRLTSKKKGQDEETFRLEAFRLRKE